MTGRATSVWGARFRSSGWPSTGYPRGANLRPAHLRGDRGSMRIRAIAIVATLLLSGTTVAAEEPPSRPAPAVTCNGAPPWFPPVTSTVYLPNITRHLGGPNGFYTPFIIQNTGAVETQLEVTFYNFTDGSCAEQYLVSNLAPGRAHSNDPNDNGRNPFLPNAQFSVVVRSFGSTIVGVVNEHQGIGDRAEALSYNG